MSDPEQIPRKTSMRDRVASGRERVDTVREQALTRFDVERENRNWVRMGYEAWDRDRRRGGPLLAGGLAYRVFLWQLPASLLLVSVLGYATEGSARSSSELARDAGLSAAVAGVVADAVSRTGQGRLWLAILGLVLTIWAGRGGARAAILTSAIAWELPSPSSARSSVRASLWFSVVMAVGVAIQALSPGLFGEVIGAIGSWIAVTVVVLVVTLLVMDRLPHRPVGWLGLLPGAVLVTLALRGLGLATGVYFAGPLDRVDGLYGGLGVAIVILLYLYLAARSFIWGQFLNARVGGIRDGEPTTDDAPGTGHPEGPR